MKIKGKKYDVMATSNGAATGLPSEIPSALPPEMTENADEKMKSANGTHGMNGAANGAANSAANGAANGVTNGENGHSGADKKSKRKTKKVSFGFDDVQEIPAVEYDPETSSPDDVIHELSENGHDLFDEDEEEEEEEVSGDQVNHKNSDIEFLRKFANLRKLGNVMEERSRTQAAAERQQVDSELARARQILQKQVRRQELARLIPGEELERLLTAVNMEDEYVVSRDDARKFMLSKRGKTSFIYLAGKDEDGEPEEEPEVEITQSEDTFSQTFSGGAGLL